MTTLNELRASLTADQRQLLNTIWRYYREQNRGVPKITLRKELNTDETALQAILKGISGDIVLSSSNSEVRSSYQLTYLGYLLTEKGEMLEDLLARFLDNVRKQYEANPDLEQIDLPAAMAAGFSDEESSFLRDMIYRTPFHGHGYPAGLPPSIDEWFRLPNLSDLRSYIQRDAMKNYDPENPIGGRSNSKGLSSDRTPGTPPAVFISHSSHDAELAALIVDLLRSSMNLRGEQIRCTSVDGYRLPAGADSDEQLRDEALESQVFIGIISAFSLASAYVLFELGARWGAKKPILPLLAPGIGPQAIKGPLAGLNALRCDNASQLHQLVSEVAKTLDVSTENPAAYERHIEAILYLNYANDSGPKLSSQTPNKAAQQLVGKEPSFKGTDDYPEADEVIKRHCEREWPDDYSMRNYCVKQQREALVTLSQGRPDDIPEDVFAGIRKNCEREWPDDYAMRVYSEGQQFNAYRELQNNR